MYFVYNLDTQKEHWYMADTPRKEALKIVYALNKGMMARLTSEFEELMLELDTLVSDNDKTYTLKNFTVLKN